MLDRLAPLFSRFEELNALLSSPTVLGDSQRLQKLSKEQAKLAPLAQLYQELHQVSEDLAGNQAIANDPAEDPEMREMAKGEIPSLKKRLEALQQEAQLALLPKDPDDDKNIILEIRAGTGGEEAALFTANLFRMYQRFAEKKGWKIEVLDINETDLGGFKEIVASIEGNNIYAKMKFESGTHRVQRVPATETQGRVHTSACTVAVLPEAQEVEVDINPVDLKIDTYRSSGAGGQHVNTTDSAIRITHLPSGVVVQCQEERSQIKNRAKAMKYLAAKLYEIQAETSRNEEAALRKSMVGSGDRSERIRTYNYPQGRVTDHRIGLTLYRLEEIMSNGDLGEIIDALAADHQAKLLQQEAKA